LVVSGRNLVQTNREHFHNWYKLTKLSKAVCWSILNRLSRAPKIGRNPF
jgi:hypothetical protein